MEADKIRELVLDILVVTAAPVTARSISTLIKEKSNAEITPTQVGQAMRILSTWGFVRNRMVRLESGDGKWNPQWVRKASVWYVRHELQRDVTMSIAKLVYTAPFTGEIPNPTWPY